MIDSNQRPHTHLMRVFTYQYKYLHAKRIEVDADYRVELHHTLPVLQVSIRQPHNPKYATGPDIVELTLTPCWESYGSLWMLNSSVCYASSISCVECGWNSSRCRLYVTANSSSLTPLIAVIKVPTLANARFALSRNILFQDFYYTRDTTDWVMSNVLTTSARRIMTFLNSNNSHPPLKYNWYNSGYFHDVKLASSTITLHAIHQFWLLKVYFSRAICMKVFYEYGFGNIKVCLVE